MALTVLLSVQLTLAAWVLLEVVLRAGELARHKGGGAHDRFTRALISLALFAAVLGAVAAQALVPSLHIPTRAAGVGVMWLGLALRVWAVAALGGSFRTTVEVDPGQPVVTRGPYRWARHPSYTGLLVLLAGLGLGLGNVLSLALCLLIPAPAFLRRIRVEEAELERVLGEPYRAYRERTARLVPGVY